MIAYVDASVLLRVALGQRDSLPEWSSIERGVSSALVTVESLRTLDRLRPRVKLADSEVAARRAKILELIASLEVVDIDSVVLDRAAQPMPTELGTLDAIHLATALLWKEMSERIRRWLLTTARWQLPPRLTAFVLLAPSARRGTYGFRTAALPLCATRDRRLHRPGSGRLRLSRPGFYGRIVRTCTT